MFYYKMKGDYHRYLAEFATGNDRKEAAENSLVAYKAASDIAMTELPPTHPIRYIQIHECSLGPWHGETERTWRLLLVKLDCYVGYIQKSILAPVSLLFPQNYCHT